MSFAPCSDMDAVMSGRGRNFRRYYTHTITEPKGARNHTSLIWAINFNSPFRVHRSLLDAYLPRGGCLLNVNLRGNAAAREEDKEIESFEQRDLNQRRTNKSHLV